MPYADRDKQRAYQRAWFERNKERLLPKAREYKWRNREVLRRKKRLYRVTRVELERQRIREWHAANPFYARLHKRHRIDGRTWAKIRKAVP